MKIRIVLYIFDRQLPEELARRALILNDVAQSLLRQGLHRLDDLRRFDGAPEILLHQSERHHLTPGRENSPTDSFG